MQPKVSIVIRCLNEEKHIGRLLQGISEQTYQNVEIIVVDSGSRDQTLDIARSYPTRIIQIIRECPRLPGVHQLDRTDGRTLCRSKDGFGIW